jgi:hypothetical protein
MGLLCRADDWVSNLECAALRAMTGLEGESAVMLFGIFIQLLNLVAQSSTLIFPASGLPSSVSFRGI